MKLSKVMKKVVVNTVNGEMLGYIVDMDIDMHSYMIKTLVIEEKPSLLVKVLPWIFKEKSCTIKVNQITSVGSDVLLVEGDKIK